MTAALAHLLGPGDHDDPRAPEVFRAGLSTARRALRSGSRRRDHGRPSPAPAAPGPRSVDVDVGEVGPPLADLEVQRIGVRSALAALRDHEDHP